MTERVQCATCRHFEPWPLNPTAAVGECMHARRHGYQWPNALHRCADHDPKPKDAHDATTEA
jgi:hypothetical protein